MTLALAEAAKSIKTAAVRGNKTNNKLKEVINLVEFESFKQRAAQAAANIKLAGESL